MTQYMLRAASLGLFLVALGCSQNNDNSSEIAQLEAKIRKIEQENRELKDANGETGIVGEKPTTAYNDQFLKSFCSLLESENKAKAISPFVENQNFLDHYAQSLTNLSNEISTCSYQKQLVYDHPFDVAEYKTDKGFLYVQSQYSPEFKVRRFIPLQFATPLDIKLYQVPTKDDKTLTTWVIQKKDNQKKGAIFLRTPYMIYGHYISYSYLALHYGKMLVLQANRGSHNSTGAFKWLDPVNVEDSRDSLDWMVQLPNSNGKVLAYGVSYDGYDALASAVTNHPALKSVIACSAPANAATDSFTSNKFVENGIFGYVTTDRYDKTSSLSSNYFEFIKTDASAEGRSKMDDVLLGFDSEEWNITSAAVDDKNHSYWKERQLLTQLTHANMPIAHVAGLVHDQDGRDTLLGFEHIQKTSKFKDQNYLILHKEGHGCGDFFRAVPLSQKLLALTDTDAQVDLSSEKKIGHYIKNQDKILFADKMSEIPLSKMALTLPETVTLNDYSTSYPLNEDDYRKSFSYAIEEDMVLNGVPKMKIKVKATIPEVPVHVDFYLLNSKGEYIKGTHGWRTGFITSKVDEVEETELIFPLINAKVEKGSTAFIMLSTRNKRVFLRSPQSREEIQETGTVEFITDEEEVSTLFLPIELETRESV